MFLSWSSMNHRLCSGNNNTYAYCFAFPRVGVVTVILGGCASDVSPGHASYNKSCAVQRRHRHRRDVKTNFCFGIPDGKRIWPDAGGAITSGLSQGRTLDPGLGDDGHVYVSVGDNINRVAVLAHRGCPWKVCRF